MTTSPNGLDLCAYWGPRAETDEGVGARLVAWLDRLAALDPLFARWHRGGWKVRPSRRDFDWRDPAAVRRAVEEGKLWSEPAAGCESRLLSYRVTVTWDTNDGQIGCSMNVGSTDVGPNSVAFILPRPWLALHDPGRDRALLEAAVECWEPEWAGVFTLRAHDAAIEAQRARPRPWPPLYPIVFDRATWLGPRFAELPVPDGMEETPFHGGRLLVRREGESTSPP